MRDNLYDTSSFVFGNCISNVACANVRRWPCPTKQKLNLLDDLV